MYVSSVLKSFSQKHSLQREGRLTDLIIKTKKVPLNFFLCKFGVDAGFKGQTVLLNLTKADVEG